LEVVVEDLTVEVEKLTGQVEVLRIAIDDLRTEVEWAIRNIYRPAWAPTQDPGNGSHAVPTDAKIERVDHSKPDDVQPDDPAPSSAAPTNAQQKGLWD
jgi:hypothetical protein